MIASGAAARPDAYTLAAIALGVAALVFPGPSGSSGLGFLVLLAVATALLFVQQATGIRFPPPELFGGAFFVIMVLARWRTHVSGRAALPSSRSAKTADALYRWAAAAWIATVPLAFSLGAQLVPRRGPSAPTQGATRSPLRNLTPVSLRASSALPRYPVGLAFDGNPWTTWSDGVPGPGRGEWIEADVRSSSRLLRVQLSTGFDATHPAEGDLFFLNAHLRVVSLYVDGRRIASLSVANAQRTALFNDIDVPLSPSGSTIRLVADDVWSGARWQDLSITEVVLQGE